MEYRLQAGADSIYCPDSKRTAKRRVCIHGELRQIQHTWRLHKHVVEVYSLLVSKDGRLGTSSRRAVVADSVDTV